MSALLVGGNDSLVVGDRLSRLVFGREDNVRDGESLSICLVQEAMRVSCIRIGYRAKECSENSPRMNLSSGSKGGSRTRGQDCYLFIHVHISQKVIIE